MLGRAVRCHVNPYLPRSIVTIVTSRKSRNQPRFASCEKVTIPLGNYIGSELLRCKQAPVRTMSRILKSDRVSAKQETTPDFHSPHHLPLKWVRKPRKQHALPLRKPKWSPFPESHRRSSPRFWITSPPIQTLYHCNHLSNRAPSYPDPGFRYAGGTSSTPSPLLCGRWPGGSKLSRHRKKVPPATSGTSASRSETMMASPRSSSNTPRGLRTWRR